MNPWEVSQLVILQSITWPIRRIKPTPRQTSDLNIVQTIVGNFVIVCTFKSDCVTNFDDVGVRIRGEKCTVQWRHVYNVVLGAWNRHTFGRGRGKGATISAHRYNAAIGIVLSI